MKPKQGPDVARTVAKHVERIRASHLTQKDAQNIVNTVAKGRNLSEISDSKADDQEKFLTHIVVVESLSLRGKEKR